MNNRYREEEKMENSEENLDNLESLDETNNSKTESDKETNENSLNEDLEDNPNEKKNKFDKKANKKIKRLEEDLVKQQEQIKKLNEDVVKFKEQYLRVLADSENFKKRIDDERIRERKYGSQRLLEKLVDSLDIFDKAVNMKTNDVNLNNFLIGFQMINNNLKTVLEEEGVKKIITKDKFDPHFHHAVDTDYDETKEEGAILSVIKDGYMYKDRVLTPALVKVNKKPVETVQASEDNTNKTEDTVDKNNEDK